MSLESWILFLPNGCSMHSISMTTRFWVSKIGRCVLRFGFWPPFCFLTPWTKFFSSVVLGERLAKPRCLLCVFLESQKRWSSAREKYWRRRRCLWQRNCCSKHIWCQMVQPFFFLFFFFFFFPLTSIFLPAAQFEYEFCCLAVIEACRDILLQFFKGYHSDMETKLKVCCPEKTKELPFILFVLFREILLNLFFWLEKFLLLLFPCVDNFNSANPRIQNVLISSLTPYMFTR